MTSIISTTRIANTRSITASSTLWSSRGFITDDNVGASKSYLIPDNQSLYTSPSCSSLNDESSLYNHIHGFIKRLISIYLSSPILLMIVPLLIGVVLGMFIQNMIMSRRRTTNSIPNATKGKLSSNAVRILFPKLFSCIISIMSSFLSVLLLKLKGDEDDDEVIRFEKARRELKGKSYTRESGIDVKHLPKHIAVIMDGNRRYGKKKYGSVTRGHWDGSKKLIDFCDWCLAEQIPILTVFAFSTENWSREADEVSSLMTIFSKYCNELRVEALEKGIRIHVLTTDGEKFPDHVKAGMERMERETSHCTNLILNVCMSYGSRSEIVQACQKITLQYHEQQHSTLNKKNHDINVKQFINEQSFSDHLLTSSLPDPDILLRTSGEMRISNFLLWQCAYSEVFFLNCHWPDIEKNDLVRIIQEYGCKRKRRFGQ